MVPKEVPIHKYFSEPQNYNPDIYSLVLYALTPIRNKGPSALQKSQDNRILHMGSPQPGPYSTLHGGEIENFAAAAAVQQRNEDLPGGYCRGHNNYLYYFGLCYNSSLN